MMIEGFKHYEKLFKKLDTPEAAVKEGKAIDFQNSTGYNHIRDIDILGRSCRVLTFDGFEGSYVIPNALSRRVQVELVEHCLSDCLQPENKTNLHGHTESSVISAQLLDLWQTESALIDAMEGDPCPMLPKTTVLSKIRWVTLGYQYDWTARKYVHEQFVPFPVKLAEMCSKIGDLVDPGCSIRPDAAIINFYPEGAVMGGHIDDAELTYDHPVISISIGCPCLFLLGGFTKDTNPLPMILRSGDILIMGGKSRLRVHAVPKVFTKCLPPLHLHPRTAGSERVHLVGCPCFLGGSSENSGRCASSSSSSSSGVNSSSSSGVYGDMYLMNGDKHGDKNGVENSHSNSHQNHHESSTGHKSNNNIPPIHSSDKEDSPVRKRRKSSLSEYEAINGTDNGSKSIENSRCITCDMNDNNNGNNDSNHSRNDSNDDNVIIEEIDSEVKIDRQSVEMSDRNGPLQTPTLTPPSSSTSQCDCLSTLKETRALRFLQTTRININVRQVYSDRTVTA